MGESNVLPSPSNLLLEAKLPDPASRPATNPSGAGFIILNSSLSPVAYNPRAAQILTYPETPHDPIDLDLILSQKVRTRLVVKQAISGFPIFTDEFKSGRRPYVCRAFELGSNAGGYQSSSVGLLLERKLAKLIALDGIAQRFKITQRERECVEHLLRGMTSKEIATQMGISSNTVKCFLRLVMIKMGVTTRSGIIGKIVACESD